MLLRNEKQSTPVAALSQSIPATSTVGVRSSMTVPNPGAGMFRTGESTRVDAHTFPLCEFSVNTDS